MTFATRAAHRLSLFLFLLVFTGCPLSAVLAAEGDTEGLTGKVPPPVELEEPAQRLVKRLEAAVLQSQMADSGSDTAGLEQDLLAKRYFALTGAFEATGYRWEALRRELQKSETSGIAYVELVSWDGTPETANIYDDMGNHLNIVDYLWTPQHHIDSAVLKSSKDRMLKMFLYCRGSDALYVHDLSYFRIHARFTRKLAFGQDRLTVRFVDGRRPDGTRWLWPQCAQLARHQEKAQPYQLPEGVQRQDFLFDDGGHLVEEARLDLQGGPAPDLRGVSRKTRKWSGGHLVEEALYNEDGLWARYAFTYDDKRVSTRTRLDGTGNRTPDFLGVASYEFAYDDAGRVAREVRKDVDGEVAETHTFEYGVFDQVAQHTVLDSSGKAVTTYAHQFNEQGARTSLAVHDGALATGKLKLDANGVALYRFQYNSKGRLLEESRHGPRKVLVDGAKDYVLTNALDGWARVQYTYEGWRLKQTKRVRVASDGRPVHEEVQEEEQSNSGTGSMRFALATVGHKVLEAIKLAPAPVYRRDHRLRDRYEPVDRYGDARFEYWPRDARLTIVQRSYVYDHPDDPTAHEWTQPVELTNSSHHLAPGEELPYLKIENLPIEEDGRLCPNDGVFYSASQRFCPVPSECQNEQFRRDNADRCQKTPLMQVARCLADGKYYPVRYQGAPTCPDGKTLVDPRMVPRFVFHYDVLFERKGYYPTVFTYRLQDWVHLGSGRYIWPFPRDFSLIRQWDALKSGFAATKKQMRCWRLDWEDAWDEHKRDLVLQAANESLASESRVRERRNRVAARIQAKYARALLAVDVVRHIKRIATCKGGMCEILYYCPEKGKCDKDRLSGLLDAFGRPSVATMDEYEQGVYYGILVVGQSPQHKWEGMQAYLDAHPVLAAGLDCLQAWMDKQQEGQFVAITDQRCLEGLDAIASKEPLVHKAYLALFVDPAAAKANAPKRSTDLDNYLLSVEEYDGQEKYCDLLSRVEASGQFVEYLATSALLDYEQHQQAVARFATSRQVNYRHDALKRGVIPSDKFRGMKAALDAAFSSGSRRSYDDVYLQLWKQDVQGCLLFAKQYDKGRYLRDRTHFEKMVKQERKAIRHWSKKSREFGTSLPEFRKVRTDLRKAKALHDSNRADFEKKFDTTHLKRLQVESPDLCRGICYLKDPRKGPACFADLLEHEAVREWEEEPAMGDQKEYHKYLALMEVLEPTKFAEGQQLLERRVKAFLGTQEAWEARRKANPESPPYREAIKDIVNNDLHLKYFWLLQLTKSPQTVEQAYWRLSYKHSKEVARYLDPKRYVYLVNLTWHKEMVGRYSDAVPLLREALHLDPGLYDDQLDRLKHWCIVTSKTISKYKRSKRLAASLLKEPANVQRALDRALKMTNRYELMFNNIIDYEEAVAATAVAEAMEQLRDRFDDGQRASWGSHVQQFNERTQKAAGFARREFGSVEREFQRSSETADWYDGLSKVLEKRRLDCRETSYEVPGDFLKWMKENRWEQP